MFAEEEMWQNVQYLSLHSHTQSLHTSPIYRIIKGIENSTTQATFHTLVRHPETLAPGTPIFLMEGIRTRRENPRATKFSLENILRTDPAPANVRKRLFCSETKLQSPTFPNSVQNDMLGLVRSGRNEQVVMRFKNC